MYRLWISEDIITQAMYMFEGLPSVRQGDQGKKAVIVAITMVEEAIGRMKGQVIGVEGGEEDVRNLHI